MALLAALALSAAATLAGASHAASAAWSSAGIDAASIFAPAAEGRRFVLQSALAALTRDEGASMCVAVVPEDVNVLDYMGSFEAGDRAQTPLHRAIAAATSHSVAIGATATDSDLDAIHEVVQAAGGVPGRQIVAADGAASEVVVAVSDMAATAGGSFFFELAAGQDSATAARFLATVADLCGTASKSGLALLLTRHDTPKRSEAARRLLAFESEQMDAALGAAPVPEVIHMTPDIMAGLLATLLLISFVTIGVCALAAIKTPRLLPTNPPGVGREY